MWKKMEVFEEKEIKEKEERNILLSQFDIDAHLRSDSLPPGQLDLQLNAQGRLGGQNVRVCIPVPTCVSALILTFNPVSSPILTPNPVSAHFIFFEYCQ